MKRLVTSPTNGYGKQSVGKTRGVLGLVRRGSGKVNNAVRVRKGRR